MLECINFSLFIGLCQFLGCIVYQKFHMVESQRKVAYSYFRRNGKKEFSLK